MGTHGLERPPAEEEIRFAIIEAADRVLPMLPPKISEDVASMLDSINIEVLVNERITQADAGARLNSSSNWTGWKPTRSIN
jgi:NADH dehydrogenase